MSITVIIEEAQQRLQNLIKEVTAGEQVIITQNEQPVAQILPLPPKGPAPHFGSCEGMLTIISEDEDHLEDFKEYMPRGCCSIPMRFSGSFLVIPRSAR